MIDRSQPDYRNTPVSTQRPRFDYLPADPNAPPELTILTPFYNAEATFRETAQSVLRQSFQQWEWIIVNDGSTDPESLSALDQYRHCDPRIIVIDHDGNKGGCVALNTGFKAARTDFVVQIHQDDLLEPTAAEKWFWYLVSYPEYAFVKGYSVGFGAQEYLWEKGFHMGRRFLEENVADPPSMVRRSVHQAVKGYDENSRGGAEDWEFWLRCANAGYWGATIPEYLTWYRRRPSHADKWERVQSQQTIDAYRDNVLHKRYPRLWEENGFPNIQPRGHMFRDEVPQALPGHNLLAKRKPRLLMVVPRLTVGGPDTFNLDLLRSLIARGWEVTIAATAKGEHWRLPHFAAHTPDVFILEYFLRLVDYPRFLRYLIASRQADAVLVANSEFGYQILPYLRAHFPDLPIVDFNHMEQDEWKNGGYPRLGVNYQGFLDRTIVSSQHLKQWMIERGARAEQIAVCYTNVDTDAHKPDAAQRHAVRRELGIGDDATVILYAARLAAHKQPRLFAETIRRLQTMASGFVVLVAGDGPEMGWLHAFVHDNHLNDLVHLLGIVPEDRLRELMAAADIFFLPSRHEGIALTVYEAMAAGLAVVAADVGGQRELVTPEAGILLPSSNETDAAQTYADVLAALLSDAERRGALGAAARTRVSESFRHDQMIERMISLFDQAKQARRTDAARVDPALASLLATEAVDHTWVYEVADWTWSERERLSHELQDTQQKLAEEQAALAEARRQLAKQEQQG